MRQSLQNILSRTQRPVLVALLLCGATCAGAGVPPADADGWAEGGTVPPGWGRSTTTNRFTGLAAQSIAGRLQVQWRPQEEGITNVLLVASADYPGHWGARDWRSMAMRRHGDAWQAELAVENLDVPVAYFLVARAAAAKASVSPVRLCWPRALGMEEPTRYFWPFLEGFEQGTESWQVLSSAAPPETSSLARNGRSSLRVVVPDGRRSATVATTRVRGRIVQERGARGIAVWLRTKTGAGEVRFGFHTHAQTTNHALAIHPQTFPVTPAWRRVEAPFNALHGVNPAELDLVTMEFVGASGTEFLIDDLSLTGRWRLDLE